MAVAHIPVTLYPTPTDPTTPTQIPSPTATERPTDTDTPSPTETATDTPSPEPTASSTPIPAPTATSMPQTESSDLTNKIDQLAAAAIQEYGLAGLTVGVRRGALAPYVKGFGYANIEKKIPAAAGTLYNIASVTKQFTAAAIMQLVERGKVGLGDPVSRYISGLPRDWRPVTVQQLLTHTSGLPDYANQDSSLVDLDSAQTYPSDVLVARIAGANLPLSFAPGSQYSYSNSDYVLLGFIVEKVSGLGYGEYLRRFISAPLGLSTAYTAQPPAGFAHGYRAKTSGLEPADPVAPSYIYAAGGIYGSAADLLAWQQALASGRVVRPESYQQMITPGRLSSGAGIDYGYGFNLGEMNGHRAIYHEGALGGYLSMLIDYPDQDVAIVLLTNTVPEGFLTPLESLKSQIADLVLAGG